MWPSRQADRGGPRSVPVHSVTIIIASIISSSSSSSSSSSCCLIIMRIATISYLYTSQFNMI